MRYSFIPAIISAFFPITAYAQTANNTTANPIEGFDKAAALITSIVNVISAIQTIILDAGGAIVVLMVVIGGIQYITNQKDAGKKTIIAAVTGMIIVILSVAIVTMLKTLLDGFNK